MKTQIKSAIIFASEKHEGQVRNVSNLPYITHPIAVYELVRKYKTSKKIDDLCIAAICHDTLEDTNTTFEELNNHFGPLVASLVLELTNDPEAIKRMSKIEYMKTKLKGISSYALTIKLCDMLSNIADCPNENQMKRILELASFIKIERKLSITQNKIADEILSFG